MKVHRAAEVAVYERNGSKLQVGSNRPWVKVESHWNYEERVRIKVGDQDVTVVAADLIKAIRCCSDRC